MPQHVRLIALALCALAILYVAYVAVDEAMTEKLDAEMINKLYGQSNTLQNNPEALGEFMKKRLHENYLREGVNITSIKDKPDQNVPVNLTKTQTIEMVTQGLAMMTIAKYERKIAEIQYSQDGRYAYVSSTEMSSGTINIPIAGGKKASLPFNAGSSCIDTLTQANKILMFVRAKCTNKTAFLE